MWCMTIIVSVGHLPTERSHSAARSCIFKNAASRAGGTMPFERPIDAAVDCDGHGRATARPPAPVALPAPAHMSTPLPQSTGSAVFVVVKAGLSPPSFPTLLAVPCVAESVHAGKICVAPTFVVRLGRLSVQFAFTRPSCRASSPNLDSASCRCLQRPMVGHKQQRQQTNAKPIAPKLRE